MFSFNKSDVTEAKNSLKSQNWPVHEKAMVFPLVSHLKFINVLYVIYGQENKPDWFVVYRDIYTTIYIQS